MERANPSSDVLTAAITSEPLVLNSTSIQRDERHDSESSLTPAQARRRVVSAVSAAMLDAFPFDEDTTAVMDYACGSGAISQMLAPHCKRIIGVDIDPNAVHQYNDMVSNHGILPEEMRAVCADLHNLSEELAKEQFDVIVCSQAYHHFSSIEETTRILAGFLKPHGMLLVSDLLKGSPANNFRRLSQPPHTHDHRHVVHRGGLSEDEIRESFERAGLIDIEFNVIESMVRDGRTISIFLSQGAKDKTEAQES